jgi:hypothetical protein
MEGTQRCHTCWKEASLSAAPAWFCRPNYLLTLAVFVDSCVVCRYYRPNARLLERLYEHFRKTGKLKQLQAEYVPPEADS